MRASPARAKRLLDPGVIARISNLNLVARLVVEGFITGLHRGPYKGFSIEFSQHREYSPGDELRYLDWKAFGRTDRFYVKEFEEETNLKAYLMVDCSASMAFRTGEMSKLDYARALSACLAYLMIKQRDSVGLATFDQVVRRFLAPRSTPNHLTVILRELEGAAASALTGVSQALHQMAERVKRRSLVVVVSDLLDEPKEVLTGLKHLRHRKHELIVFHVLSPEEIELPYEKLTTFRDLETGERVEVDPRAIRNEYRAEMERFMNAYRRGCHENDIDYVVANTGVPLDRCLSSYLAGRAKRR